jgi:predicted DNA-binding transcriptional regulator YafY
MSTMTSHDLIQQIIAAAYAKQILQITYFDPSGKTECIREIEPYSVIEIAGATMLKAYQLQPTTGWRLFNTDLLGTVRETARMFQPRRSIVLSSNGDLKHIAPVEARDYEQQEYEKLLQAAIIDLRVEPDEVRKLAEFRTRYGLTAEEVRGVHYKVFSDCLAAVTKDRIVSDEERQMLIELNACLRDCGAGLIQ